MASEVGDVEREREDVRRREQELSKELKRLETEGAREQRQKTVELERKMESLIRDFEYQIREAVNAVQDRAAAQKLSKDAERRIAKLRREFKEQFDAGIVAHKTGGDQDDPNARPHETKRISEGDTVKLKSLGRTAVIKRKLDENTFEVEMGAMKMKIPRDDVAEVFSTHSAVSPAAAARAKGITVSLKDEQSAPSEINVIGQTGDQATAESDNVIDRAVMAGGTEGGCAPRRGGGRFAVRRRP